MKKTKDGVYYNDAKDLETAFDMIGEQMNFLFEQGKKLAKECSRCDNGELNVQSGADDFQVIACQCPKGQELDK